MHFPNAGRGSKPAAIKRVLATQVRLASMHKEAWVNAGRTENPARPRRCTECGPCSVEQFVPQSHWLWPAESTRTDCEKEGHLDRRMSLFASANLSFLSRGIHYRIWFNGDGLRRHVDAGYPDALQTAEEKGIEASRRNCQIRSRVTPDLV